jgi:hypothetical protein
VRLGMVGVECDGATLLPLGIGPAPIALCQHLAQRGVCIR